MSQSRTSFLLAFVTIALLCSSNLWAQTQGAIVQGQILDASGAAVANAIVQWSAVGIPGGGTDNSDSAGNFAFEVPLNQGGVQVQVSVIANLYLSTQISVQAQGGEITPVHVVLHPKSARQFATVSGILRDSKTHKGIPSADIRIIGAGGLLTSQTDASGEFAIAQVGYNTQLALQAETPENPCILTSIFPLSVSKPRVKVKLAAQILIVQTPHCPNNEGIAHQSEAQAESPELNIDDTLQWSQADTLSINMNSSANAWNAGHLSDILRGPAGTGLVVASDEGGVWLIAENGQRSALPVSNTWPSITMTSLAYGPGGSGDVYGGTWDESPSSPGGILWETDTSAGFPLLNWYPVNPQPPCKTIEKTLVIVEVGRIVLACDQGLFWSVIPPSPSVHGVYNWQMAAPSTIAGGKFSGLAKGTGWIAGSGHEGTIVAAGYGGTAPNKLIFTGKWQSGVLTFKHASVVTGSGSSFGRTSIAACANNSTYMYAVAADSGNVNMGGIWASLDGGLNWTPENMPSNPGVQGGYNNVIAAAQDCSSVAVGWQGGTWLSFDGAKSWMHIDDSSGQVHADVHALTYDPADASVLFIGSDGGVISASGIAPNVQPELESDWNRELLNLEFNPGAASTSFAGLVTGAAQDNGALYADVPGGPWQHMTSCGCDGGQTLFATPPGIASGDDLLIEREWGAPNFPLDRVEAVGGFIPKDQQLDIHIDHGSETVDDGYAQAVRTPGGFINGSGEAMIAVNGDANNLFGLFSMPDGSDIHWEQIGTLAATESISAVGPAFDGSSVFVGTKSGNIYLFNAPYNGTALQLSVTPPQSGGASVSGLFAFFSSVAWASYNVGNNGYVMFWNGTSWNASGFGVLPNSLPFNSITARDLNTIFVSSSAAVYDSRNAGGTWDIANIGLPVNITHNPQLYYLPTSSTGPAALYLTTWGRSLWTTLVK